MLHTHDLTFTTGLQVVNMYCFLLSGLFRSLTVDVTSRTGVVVIELAVMAILLELPRLVGEMAEI